MNRIVFCPEVRRRFVAANSNEFRMCHFRNDAGKGCLSASGRTRENYRWQTIRFNRPAQKLSRRKNVSLTDKFLERARPHPRCKRRCAVSAFAITVFLFLEKVVHRKKYGAL